MGDRRFRLLKAGNTIAYVAIIWLTWRFVDGEFHWKLAIGAIILSACWLALTYLRMSHLLKTYFDVLSRLEFLIPAILATGLAVFAVVRAHHWSLRLLAAAELVAWAVLFAIYRRNRRTYERQGHGPVPAGCWISPPDHALQPGDLLLTSGLVAAGLRESVGHAETVVRAHRGNMHAFSSYMGRGLVLNPLGRQTARVRTRGHYIALRLNRALSEEQIRRAAAIVQEMLESNARWRYATNRRRRKLVGLLPLPRSWRKRLFAAIRADGYDWFGLFMGRLARDRWTCIGACLEMYRRVGVTTRPYGTGLLGFGSSVFDPIMPVRLLDDPAFRLLKTDDDNGPAGEATT